MDVWIVEVGEYEDRHVSAVFATEELALAHIAGDGDEEPTRWAVWDKPPLPIRYYDVKGLYGPEGRPPWSPPSNWTETAPRQWMYRFSFDSLEVHCPEAVQSAEMSWWDGRTRSDAVHVRVAGSDEQAVEAEFARLWANVVAGERPPDPKERKAV